MKARFTIRTPAELGNLAYHIGNMKQPFTAVIEPGEGKRGISQNGLFHAWLGQIAKQRGDVTEGRVKAECHIQWGIPILRGEDADYSSFIDAALGGRSYGDCCNIIERGFVPCSSLMNKPQLSRYMDAIWREWSPRVELMDPEALKWRSAP